MRIHELSKANGVTSKSVIHILNLVGKPVKSASSRVEIDDTNRIFFESVVAASRSLEARSKRIIYPQN